MHVICKKRWILREIAHMRMILRFRYMIYVGNFWFPTLEGIFLIHPFKQEPLKLQLTTSAVYLGEVFACTANFFWVDMKCRLLAYLPWK